MNIDISNPTGDEAQAVRDHGFDIRRAMRDDLFWILKYADAVYVLPGSEESAGVKVERALAECIGIEIVGLFEMKLEEVI
jgi:hypothetical protein